VTGRRRDPRLPGEAVLFRPEEDRDLLAQARGSRSRIQAAGEWSGRRSWRADGWSPPPSGSGRGRREDRGRTSAASRIGRPPGPAAGGWGEVVHGPHQRQRRGRSSSWPAPPSRCFGPGLHQDDANQRKISRGITPPRETRRTKRPAAPPRRGPGSPSGLVPGTAPLPPSPVPGGRSSRCQPCRQVS